MFGKSEIVSHDSFYEFTEDASATSANGNEPGQDRFAPIARRAAKAVKLTPLQARHLLEWIIIHVTPELREQLWSQLKDDKYSQQEPPKESAA